MRVSIEITDAPAEGAPPVQLRVQEQAQRPQAGAEFDGGPDTAGERAEAGLPSPAAISGGPAPVPPRPGAGESTTPWIIEAGAGSPA
jgi:hypothetical protein